MFELLTTNKQKTKINFDVALDFAGAEGSTIITNSGTGPGSFVALGDARITRVEHVIGDSCLLNSGTANSLLRSSDALAGGMRGRDFYVGFYCKHRGNTSDPYRGMLHLGAAGSSANGITLINSGLYLSNPAGSNWNVIAMPTPSTALFNHYGIAKRRSATNDQYRLFINGKIIGTFTPSLNTIFPGDDSSQIEIGINHSAAQSSNAYYANFRMKLGEYVHWDEFNPADDYL